MVLEGYKQNKKIFTSPLESAIGDKLQKTSYLDDTLPNILWIAFLYNRLGLNDTINLITKICKALDIKGFMSEMYFKISAKSLLKELNETELKTLKEKFYDFITIYPRSPLLKIYTQQELDNYFRCFDKSLEEIQKVAVSLDDKRSELTVITLGILIKSMINNNILQGMDTKYTNLDFLESNISNKDVKGEYGAHYRSLIQIFLMLDNNSKRWSEYFWNIGANTNCNNLETIFGEDIRLLLEDEEFVVNPEDLNYMLTTNKQFQIIFENILKTMDYEKFRFRTTHFYRDQIILGLINREITLIRKILTNHNLWEKEIVSILFRSIIENHINLLWFHKNGTEDDALSFIDYGWGNMVLYNSKLKEKLPKLKQNTYFEKLTKKFDEDIEKETNPMLQDVKIGNWTNNTIRNMSIDINRKELHDLYSVFSDMSHGSWNILIDKFLKFCTNPLHKRHKIPKIYRDNINFMTPFMCMNYLLELLHFINLNYDLKINKKDYEQIKTIRNEFEIKFLKRWKT